MKIVILMLVLMPLTLTSRPKPFCILYNHGKQKQLRCNKGPDTDVLQFFNYFYKKSLPFPHYLSKRSIMEIIEWLYTPDMKLYLWNTPKKFRLSLVEQIIPIIASGLSPEEQRRFILRGITIAWNQNPKQLKTWFKLISKKQFLLALRLFDSDFPKTLTLTHIQALHKACQERNIPLHYTITGNFLVDQKGKDYSMEEFRKQDIYNYFYITLPSKEILKFSTGNDSKLFYNDPIPLKEILPLIKKDLNQIPPGKRETLLNLYLRREDHKNIKLLRKYGAKTYKELQNTK